ncbi:MAG: hypothetical protein QOK02_5172 [Mycobacterium sp.]|nr:hypothetical protein [Mycobacterium sp.]
MRQYRQVDVVCTRRMQLTCSLGDVVGATPCDECVSEIVAQICGVTVAKALAVK